MGTNYYHRTSICRSCGRCDERHIGKSSGGWTFSFRGYPEDGIKSWQDWLLILKAGGKIYNEYGDQISIRDFIKLVKSKSKNKLNHSKECPEGNWLDRELNSFSSSEFC